ncbi:MULTISPECIES: response regulator transcription factor [Gudongella]|jgi:DNA-binding response OmpR family regulator|uniref:response regulator transcription factor n=1 Tax=Gudongella oleilytica TaxID=1582259 RepID=UPI002A35BF1D|nr:response regulator transcription factor [Gudongella oleilytica]MDY0258032.1 response regulator transcription factor [Gudongella oleilytica]
MTKILIVEDEEKLARFVELELQYEGYEVEKAYDGRAGIDMVKASPFDLVLLDIMLPGLNGIEVLRRIRQTSDIPVILLTARDAVVDKVTGLDSGADDYITKPFAIEELLARIRALLRKKEPGSQAQAKDVMVYKELSLDTKKREVHVKGTVVPLTKKEFDLLELLMENRNIVLSRETILDKIWGYDFSGGTNAVDVYIRYLRAKLEEPFGTKIFSTVRGVGYAIKDEDQ